MLTVSRSKEGMNKKKMMLRTILAVGLAAALLLSGLPMAQAGTFTVEFNGDGTIARAFNGGITSPLGQKIHPHPEKMKDVIAHYICFIQYGKEFCVWH